MEPRNLKAALKFYCNKELVGAHDAMNDVRATVDILNCQIDMYQGVNYEDDKGNIEENPVRGDVDSLHNFTSDPTMVDYMGKIKYNSDGVEIFAFGKYKGKSVGECLVADPGYFNWLMGGSEFSNDTKRHFNRILAEYNNR